MEVVGGGGRLRRNSREKCHSKINTRVQLKWFRAQHGLTWQEYRLLICICRSCQRGVVPTHSIYILQYTAFNSWVFLQRSAMLVYRKQCHYSKLEELIWGCSCFTLSINTTQTETIFQHCIITVHLHYIKMQWEPLQDPAVLLCEARMAIFKCFLPLNLPITTRHENICYGQQKKGQEMDCGQYAALAWQGNSKH